MRKTVSAAALLAIFALQPVSANDSTAETAAGGLVLTRSDDIDMVSEDLFVSAEEVRVAYVFRNTSDVDIRTLVAFPMPPRDFDEERHGGDIAFPSEFETRVDGRAVEVQVQRRATLNGVDFSDALNRLGVPLLPEAGGAYDLGEALAQLPPADQARLEELGLVEVEEYDTPNAGHTRYLLPLWTAEETWYWEQVFPAGRDIAVTHSYRPGTGGGMSALGSAEFRESEYGREMIDHYCIDPATLAGVERIAGSGEYPLLMDLRVSYILTTGANWRSPIGSFRLVVDKGSPDNIVSFCAEGVRRISPTQFEVRYEDFVPERDLDVIIFQPVPEM